MQLRKEGKKQKFKWMTESETAKNNEPRMTREESETKKTGD